MMNPFKEINWNPQTKDLRKFALSLIIGFPCLAVVFFLVKWWRFHAHPTPDFFLKLGGIGAAVGLICLIIPFIARPLYYVWYALAGVMGLVMGNLIFAVMYYIIFSPLALLMRMTGRDPLQLKAVKAESHWIDAEPAPPPARYFSQY
jgi:hypothetical protein